MIKWWDNIRNYFYKRHLAEKIAALKVKRAVINFDDAKTVGIIYDSTKPENDAVVSKFAEGLRGAGKTVELFGFVNDKKVESKPGITIINPKNLSWTRVPSGDAVEKFAGNNFDILFSAFVGENFPLEYISAISNARWRLGVYSEGKTDRYDMMVKVGERNDIQYFLEQAVYFLKQIKYDSK